MLNRQIFEIPKIGAYDWFVNVDEKRQEAFYCLNPPFLVRIGGVLVRLKTRSRHAE